MKIVIVTDAWYPQVNGVVRTYENTIAELIRMGHQLRIISPEEFRTIPCPGYPGIRLAVQPAAHIARLIGDLNADAVHIATEGPLGHAARSYCRKQDMSFTTSFHTQFPEYIRMRIPVPLGLSYAWLRWFHGAAERTFVPTESQKQRLQEHGFRNIVVWGKGVDTHVFRPGARLFAHLPGPVFINMGRVAVEKNIKVFLDMDLPGSKVVVGDGPDLPELQQRYPEVVFTGYKFGTDLADCLASADVFVFPSVTDTFGIVLLEAMACGIPVAAYPVTGPIDVVRNGITGILDSDLRRAALAALEISPASCLEYARSCTWRDSTRVFLNHLATLTPDNSLHPVDSIS